MGASAIIGGIGAVTSIVGGSIGSGKAKRAEQRAERKLKELEANRQNVIDPYSGFSNVSGSATNVYEALEMIGEAVFAFVMDPLVIKPEELISNPPELFVSLPVVLTSKYV